jgi:branched-chain amino acid transport system substrate-binding protein
MCKHALFASVLSLAFISEVSYAAPAKITILLPFTSVYKHLGESAKKGFLLGIKKEGHDIKADLDNWVTFDFVDSKADPASAEGELKKVVAQGSKAIMGIVSSDVAEKIRDQVINEHKIPFIVFGAAGTPKIRTKNPLYLRMSFSNYLAPYGLALWELKNPVSGKPTRKWSCIYADYAAGKDVCEGFALAYKNSQNELKRIPVPFKTLEKTKQIEELVSLKPDFAVAFFAGAEASFFVRDYYKLKAQKQVRLLAPGFLTAGQLLKDYEKTQREFDTAVGLVTASHWDVDLKNDENVEFVKNFRSEYTSDPDIYSMHGYDTGRLLVKALKEMKGQWNGTELVNKMRTVPLMSPRHGTQLKFDSHGDPLNAAYIYQVKKVGNQLVQERIAEFPAINLDTQLP